MDAWGHLMLWHPKKADTDDLMYSIAILAGTVSAVALAVKAGFELAEVIKARNLPQPASIFLVQPEEGDDDAEGAE